MFQFLPNASLPLAEAENLSRFRHEQGIRFTRGTTIINLYGSLWERLISLSFHIIVILGAGGAEPGNKMPIYADRLFHVSR
ncbi:MAG: hypothetical protein NTY64_15915 [Deltaproteobacteria bacterium]|nr:hypothetical protein [Deltaproteobacteria bacterium]